MKKTITLLTAILLLVSGLVCGQTREEVVAYTLDGTETGGSNGYATESEITQNGITWMVMGNTTMSPWRIGGKNLTDVDRTAYSTDVISDNITKIVVEHGTASNITVNSMTLVVSSSADFSNPTSTLNGDFTANSTTTFNRPSSANWANMYYKICYNVTVSGTSNRYFQFISATMYKENGGSTMETVATPTFTPAEGAYTEAQNVTISTTTAGASIYYTTDGTTPTNTNGTLYATPLAISETTTVKAIAVKEGMNNSSVATATYTFPAVYPNIAAWKADHTATNSTVSSISGDLTAVFQNANNLYVQDATGGLLIYGNLGKTYNNGDVISGGISGTSTLYNGTIEFVPTSTFPEGITGIPVQPTVVTAAEVIANYDTYAGRLVKMESVSFDQDHTFATNNSANRTVTFTQGGTTYTCFDSFKVLAGLEVTEGEVADIIGLVGCYNTTRQIFPRSTDDIIPQTVATYYSVNIAEGIANGTVSADPTSAVEGTTINVTATPDNGYELTSLTYSYAGTNPIDITEAKQFNMPAADVTINATFGEIVLSTVATPTFTPAAGTFTETQNVTIACATEGASIYYSLDGTDPVTDAGITGTLYQNAIVISQTTTVKAVAVKEGMNNSEIASATYTINLPILTFNKLVNHTDVTAQGTYMIVEVAGGFALTSANGTSSAPTAVPVTIENNAITGQIDAALQWHFTAVEGGYKISPVNDSEAYLYSTNANNGVRIGTNDNNVWELNITDEAKPSYHGFKNVSVSRFLGVYNNADWRAYTSINNNIMNSQIEIFVLGDAPTPTYYNITVANVSNGTVEVSKPRAQEGETITVTATPTEGYELTSLTYSYTGATPIDITEARQFTMPAADVTVNAVFSELSSVATPVLSLAEGSYLQAQQVSITCATEGATIYYTLDGNDPTPNSSVYSAAINISATTTVKAMAVKEGMNNSAIASATYTIIPMVTIAEAKALNTNEYALVQGVVTFIDGRNIYIQDETAGIDLYLNNNTVPSTLALGDLVMAYGKKAVYNGLIELSGIAGNNANQFVVVSSGNELPVAVKTIAEILEDYQGANLLQSTRVQIVDAVIGAINTNNNTPITQGESTMNIYKMPVVEGLLEDDFVTVTGVLGCFNAVQLRVASADDVEFTHPAYPNLVAEPSSLAGFTCVEGNGPSAVKSFVITGSNLSSPAYIYPSENFQISSLSGDNFIPETRIKINSGSGNFSYSIYVRLKADLEIGSYSESLSYCCAETDTAYVTLTGSVVAEGGQTGDYVRVADLSQIGNGAKVIFAARFDENANDYYAMTAQASGKPTGVLFTSVAGTNAETLPSTIIDEESTYYWTVTTDGTNYTFTNAEGDVLGYTSGTNFANGGDNTAWSIVAGTSEEGAMVPGYSAFVISNVNNAVRAFALNSNHNFGPYHTQNMTASGYNFFIDIFATTGSGTLVCAAPTFSPEGGTYYEAQMVTLSCTTADATIHYTLDGTDPTANSAVYSEPIAISENTTIKAMAVKEGYEDSQIAEAQYVIVLGAVVIFNQDWEGDMNGWTFVTVEGSKPWTIGQYQGNHYANANGYNGGVNEQWCISPAFNLNSYSDVTLTFVNAKNYTGPDMQLFFSNDYDGADPTAATWTELTFEMSTGSYAWTESGVIELIGFTGNNCYIGFKYTSTEDEAAAWEVDDIMLMGFTTDSYLSVSPAALTGFTHVVEQGPSAAQSFTLSAANIGPAPGGTTGSIIMQVTGNGYEISLDNETFTWQIDLTVNGNLAPTPVYVRLNGAEVGDYSGSIDIYASTSDEATVTLSGTVTEPVQGGDWNRIASLADLADGDQVVIASRYDATVGDGYYAMTAGVSGKPDGVLFTSVNSNGVETLPDAIVADIETFVWNVTLNDTILTLVNAAGDTLGYSSSTNFSGNTNTDWAIAFATSGDNAMVPNYAGFVITNVETPNRGIAKNASNKFGAYSTSNINNGDYNFYLDLFVQGGTTTPTVATPVFSVASGTYYQDFEVELTCATEGAVIYYTNDGSDPTAESMIYGGPLHIDGDVTLKAIAMKEGYDNSNIATANYVLVLDLIVIFNQDWEGEMDGWTFVTVEGNKPWMVSSYGGNQYAYANGYNDEVDNEQWCISPAFDLTPYMGATLTFMNAKNYSGPDLELYFSNDYNGQDPTGATWQPLEFNMSEGGYNWAESGEISLDGFTGESCYIGFRYISTIEDGAAAWEVDDILLYATSDTTSVSEFTVMDVNLWNHNNEIFVENNTNTNLQMVVFDLLGRQVFVKPIGMGSVRFSHNLNQGLYIVTLQNNKERMSSKMVVR